MDFRYLDDIVFVRYFRDVVLCCIICSDGQQVKNSLFHSRRSRDGTVNSRRVLIPQNVDIIVHIP